jgi:hypothetical protein
VKLRDLEHVTSVVVTHQIRDAFYIATPQAARRDGQVRIVRGDARAEAHAQFMVLQGGRIHFRGTGWERQDSQDPYLKRFLCRRSRRGERAVFKPTVSARVALDSMERDMDTDPVTQRSGQLRAPA